MVKEVSLPYLRKRTRKIKGKSYTYWTFERRGCQTIRLPDPSEPDFLVKYDQAKSGRRPPPPKFTFDRLIMDYKENSRTLAGKKSRAKGWSELAPRTQSDYAKALDYIAENIGDQDPRNMTRADVVDAMDANTHRKKFANTLQQVFSILFNHAKRIEWCDSNPAEGVEKFVTGEGHVAWPLPLQAAFWNACADFGAWGQQVRLAMVLYLETAQRGGDVLDIKWPHVSPEGIEVDQNKTGTPVFAPMTGFLFDMLEVERERQIGGSVVNLSGYVLQGPKGGKLSYNTLNDRFVKVREHAGIDAKYKLHGWRYSAAQELGKYAGEAGASVTGHLDPRMFQKYAGNEMRKQQAIQAQKAREEGRKGKRFE